MKQVLLSVVLAVAFAFGASAQENADTLAAVLGAKLRVTSENGSYDVIFNEDGTYVGTNGISGSWELKEGEICVRRTTGEANCMPFPAGKAVGDSWESQDATGAAVTFTIVAKDA